MTPRYSVGIKRDSGFPVLVTTHKQKTVNTYRTYTAANEVAAVLNKHAAQEYHRTPRTQR